MALSTARMHRVRGRPPLLAAGINSLIHSHSSSVRSLGYIFSLIYLFYTTPEDFSDRLLIGYSGIAIALHTVKGAEPVPTCYWVSICPSITGGSCYRLIQRN